MTNERLGSYDAALELTERVAVVTGAASDIGLASAQALASGGARVVLGDIDEAKLRATAARLEEAGATVQWRTVDVSVRSDLDALVEQALAAFGRVDVMANLAGVICDGLVKDTREEDIDRVLSVNLKGVYFGCQAALSVMEETGGSIVNMSSTSAFHPIPQLSCYSMSKAGVVALTRVLAAEAGPLGIRVNAIAPGFIAGGMTLRHVRAEDGSVDPAAEEAVRAKARRRNPLRTTGVPADVGHLIRFLASDASRYMTGQVLHPNGGSYMA